MEKKKITGRIKKLFIGKRTLKDRFFTAFFPSLALSFILFLFGPLDLSAIAESYVDYRVTDIVLYCLRFWAVIFAGMFLISWLPGGKLHALLSSLFTGLALAFYIQGNWLNIDLGALNGEAVNWEAYSNKALVNLAVFTAIVLIPFLIHFFSHKIWRNFVVFISGLLFIMQLVPLGMMLAEDYRNKPDESERYIVSKDLEYVLGKENIVVFILDFTGPEEMSKMLAKYPGALDPFRDFTCFDNYNTEYVGTFPAAAYLFTHQPYDRTIPYSEWFKNIWHSEEAGAFYSQLHEAGWTTRAFHNLRMVSGKAENEFGKIDNVIKVTGPQQYSINPNTFRKLIKLSFYRYFPLIMKAPFWLYTDDINGMKVLSENEQSWGKYRSIKKYWDQRLSAGDEPRVYITYHYAGAHAPYDLNESGKEALTLADAADQLAGHFNVISEYIQQMKDYHIYDSSAIIITTDHGNFTYPQSILYIKPVGQRQEKMTYNHAPVSQSEYMETIALLAGLEKGQFGRSFFDVPEDEVRERCVSIYWNDPDLPVKAKKASNALKELCYTGDSETVHQMIVNGEYESTELKYPFY